MKKTTLSLLAVLIIASTPFLANADTVSDLREQLQTVLNKIEELKTELTLVESGITPTVGGGSACVTISRNLSKGMDNDEVRKLQLFLAQDPTLYPEGITSGYFGRLTELAVQRWQARHGVISYGTAASTGYGAVGPKTRQAIEAACGNSGGGYVEGTDNVVSFAFATTSGQAPFNASVTISMLESSCMSYQVNWGDGSVPSTHTSTQTSSCGGGIGTATVTHTYALAGDYTATLFAGKGNVDNLPQVTTTRLTVLAGQPYVKVLSPNGDEELKLGDNTNIRWQVANQPQDSAVVFYIVGPSGTYRFAMRSHRSAEFNWIVGDRVCDGNGCNVQVDTGSRYKVRAALYTPADACIDFCDVDSVTPQFLASDESDDYFSISQLGSSGNSPLSLIEESGDAPFTAAMTVKLAPVSGGVGNFEVDFGDGSTTYKIHIPAGEDRTTKRTFSHTYANEGDYYVRLRPVGAVQHMAEERIHVGEPDFSVVPQSRAVAPVTVEATFKKDEACSYTDDITRTYTIDWGDNTDNSRYEVQVDECDDEDDAEQSLSTKTFTHEYDNPGTYRPELTMNAGGVYNKQVETVEVEQVDWSISPTFGYKPLNTKVSFEADESCVMGNATDVTYTIDWGDGTANTTHTKSLASCGDTFSLNTVDREYAHTYQEIGRYTVELTIRKGNIGSSYSRSKEVVVDVSVLRNGWRQLAYNVEQLHIGENMAAAIQSLFVK